MTGTPSICHVITGLKTGGAEMMLWKLLSASEFRVRSSVISLRDKGTIGPRLEALGIPVTDIGIRKPLVGPIAWWRLRRAISDCTPDLIQGWMYHGNLAALLGRPNHRWPVTWSIRQSFGGYSNEKAMTRIAIKVGAWLSSRAARIIYNARSSARQHEAIGYDPRRTVVIPNGFDLNTFRPDPVASAQLRARLALSPQAIVVGNVARYHPMKDHLGLVQAASVVAHKRPDVEFVLAGAGVDGNNHALIDAITAHGLNQRVHLLGPVEDIAPLMAGLDVLCQASAWGEAFPNVLGEAMASAIPCVTTDVGDSAWLVDEAGIVVHPNEPAALASALLELICAPVEVRRALGFKGRQRIQREFSLSVAASRYSSLYREVLAGS